MYFITQGESSCYESQSEQSVYFLKFILLIRVQDIIFEKESPSLIVKLKVPCVISIVFFLSRNHQDQW